ncbi:MAG: hypothetical protein ACE14P_00500 [Methanotrichaceae archaeon]
MPVIAMVLLGIAISTLGFLKFDIISNNKYAFAIPPLVLSCFVIPYPYNAGLIVTAAALVVSLLIPRARPLWLGALLSGVILILHSLTLSIYYIFAPSFHQVGWLASMLSLFADQIGLQATSNNGLLFVYAQKNLFPFTITLEKLGFYPWILIFSGALIIIFLSTQNTSLAFKRSLGLISVSIIYLLARYLLLVCIFFATDVPYYAGERLDIFINPILLIASFVPLILLFIWMYPIHSYKLDFRLDIDRKQAFALMLLMLSIFCFTASAIFQDPGVKKDGRILVDEIHSLWEFSTLKLDKEWYGESSTYNAYSMVEWLNDTYKVYRIVSPAYKNWTVAGAAKVSPDVVSDKITYDILKNYDIFIIKTPSNYDPEEVDAIVRFVNDGGGLFLIGDHTNFGGTSTSLNQILNRFGIELGFDSVNTMDGRLYYYKRGIMPHPIVKYMPYLDFMTGCSIKAPLGGEPVVLGFNLAADPGEYASSGFFRETRSNDPTQVTNTIWGLINQAVALKYGKGRAVVFSDSTIISNFRSFFGGTPNLIIGCIEYLNYRNSFENGKQILFLLGILFGAFAAYLLGKTILGERKMTALVVMLALGSLAVSGAIFLLSTKTQDIIPSQFYVKNHTVCFDGEHSNTIVSKGNKSGSYETFFIWTQRVNLTPVIEDNFESALEKGRILVIIDPIKELFGPERDALLNYIKEGNSVLLMLDPKGPGSYLTQSFGMDTYYIEQPSNASNLTLDQNITQGLPIKPWGLAIKGGKPLISMGNRTVAAEANYGKGKFVIFTDSQAFRDGFYGDPGYMGYSGTDPNLMNGLSYNLRSLYNLEYHIFEDVLSSKYNIAREGGKRSWQ